MKTTTNKKNPTSDHMNADISGAGGRVRVDGPALAVVAVIAVIGLILISVMLVNLSRHAIDPAIEKHMNAPARQIGYGESGQ